MSIGEERAKLEQAVEVLNGAIGKLAAIQTDIETATGLVSSVLGGYGDTRLTEALGKIAESSMLALDTGQMMSTAAADLEEYIGRM